MGVAAILVVLGVAAILLVVLRVLLIVRVSVLGLRSRSLGGGLFDHGSHVSADNAANRFEATLDFDRQRDGATNNGVLSFELEEEIFGAVKTGIASLLIKFGKCDDASRGVLEWVGVAILVSLSQRVELRTSQSRVAICDASNSTRLVDSNAKWKSVGI